MITGLQSEICFLDRLHGGKETAMLTESQVKQFAEDWLHAWNSHDLDAILSHYGPEIVLTSPVAARLLDDPSGMVRGHSALRDYFKRGLEAYPDLTFELLDIMWGLSSVVLYYKNQSGTKTGEFMELDANLKVTRVVANYSR
jgi:SnoaL-like protein